MTPLDVDVLGPGLMVLQRYHAPILEIPEVKALVLAIFFGLLFTNITLLPQLSPGLEQKIVLPRDSYLQVGGCSSVSFVTL
jgi:Niemann-Pick C1 protein